MRRACVARGMRLVIATLLLAAPAGVEAQAVRGAPSWLSTAGSSSGLVRGIEAAGGNPATLALPGGAGTSVAFLAGSVGAGLDPVGLRKLASFQGAELSSEVREDWLRRMESAGGWKGSGALEVTPLAVQVGSFLFDVGSAARVRGVMSPDAAELLLFGNAGRRGDGEDLSLAGSSFDGAAFTTFGMAAGFPVEVRLPGRAAVGIRVGYTLGHTLVVGRDRGSGFHGRPPAMELDFPIVDSFESGARVIGRGLGLDLGAAWEGDAWVAAVGATNILNTFDWDRAALRFRAGTAHAGPGGSGSDLDPRPLHDAPAAVHESVDELRFATGLGGSAAFALRTNLRVAAEARHRFGGDLAADPASHLGLAVEHRPRPWATLRSGVAAISEGYQAGWGGELTGGRLVIGGALLLRDDVYGRRWLGSLSFSAGPASSSDSGTAGDAPAGS